MKTRIQFGAVVVLVGLLAACASTPPKPSDSAVSEESKTAPATSQTGAGAQEMDAKMAQDDLRRQQLLSEERVYFAFDSSAIDEPSRAIVEAHAAYIMENPNITVSLEGHCDERGTREYNLALGERRAQSVQKLMLAIGVPAKQLKVNSFGEEKPLDAGHDESAWRKNRRVELVYKTK